MMIGRAGVNSTQFIKITGDVYNEAHFTKLGENMSTSVISNRPITQQNIESKNFKNAAANCTREMRKRLIQMSNPTATQGFKDLNQNVIVH